MFGGGVGGCHFTNGRRDTAHTQKHAFHTCRCKVHQSPLRDLFISGLWHKSHSGMQAYLSISLETQRSPQRAPRRSTCHFQLVPQRESSSTKRKMGAHYWIPLSALKYRSGGYVWLPWPRMCHLLTTPHQSKADDRRVLPHGLATPWV